MTMFQRLTKNTLKLFTASLILATLTACTTHSAPLYQKVAPPPYNTLTDAQLIKIAKWDERQPKEYISKQVIGVHNGVTVIVEMQCSDVCPENTAQVVYYEVPKGQHVTVLAVSLNQY
ncbi:hypothetical protein [Psychrobacter sp.]|uniref:hypothetical protein n=1 Tax=Psychrobacter sp. TaxID=56811 RepID=UPI0025E43665|nr:hypothetical protein [Psychrobacter sp.]